MCVGIFYDFPEDTRDLREEEPLPDEAEDIVTIEHDIGFVYEHGAC